MHLTKFHITVGFNPKKGEINSIKYLGNEILYQGDQGWKKTFPICFPVLSFSRKYSFEGESYTLPKHGFWAELDWTVATNKNKIIAKARINHPNYPFQLDVTHTISILPNTVTIKVVVKNIGYKPAFFHFGFHPGFKIDPESFLFFSQDHDAYWINKEGKLTTQKVILNENVPIKSLPFMEEHPTIFVEDWKRGQVMLENDKYAVWCHFKSRHLQIWKNPEDDFVCIEPWDGVQDDLYEHPADVTKKRDIIVVRSRKTYTTKLKLKLHETEVKKIEE